LQLAQQDGRVGEPAFHSIHKRLRVFEAFGGRAEFLRGKSRLLDQFIREAGIFRTKRFKVLLQAMLAEDKPGICTDE
jgi:hypothetical protein